MAELIKVNKKCINDPLYTPVEAFLKARIARLEVEGPAAELELAKERYTGLVAGDLVIENPVMFPDGITRVCFCARKTGFARVDVDIERVTMKDILDDFVVPIIEITDLDNLKAYVKSTPTEAALLWCVWLDSYGVLLNQDSARSIAGPMAAFGELFFSEYTTERESLSFIDYDTLESGTVTITDASFGTGVYPLFIYELVLDEANVPGITSNLPESITTQRGKDFVIPNTYWFNTTEDITHTATIELTTKLGYTIPTRSEDGNEIDGQTIFGSATNEVIDEIIVRVTYIWNNRPVKKTFRITVNIEKDTAFDLTFDVSPPTVTTASGSEVSVGITAFFKGEKVRIGVPPTYFKSNIGWGDLRYQETTADGVMMYLGVVTAFIPNTFDRLQSLYQSDFTYEENSNIHTAPAYLNMIVVKPGTLPRFEIRGLTNVIRGFINNVGEMEVNAFYGETPIPATNLNIKTGVKGTKGLLRYDEVLDDGVKYTIVKDSNIPGQEVSDVFDQVFRWTGPNGVRNTITRPITVIVSKVSTVEIVPVFAQPLSVNKYQSGRPPFKLMVNGVDATYGVLGYTFTDPAGMIVPKEGDAFNWIVTSSPEDQATETTVKFKFRYSVDGVWQNFEYDQRFLVNVWTQAPDTDEPGVNTKTVATPNVTLITGLTEETGTFDFQVYYEATDITATALVLNDRTVVPSNITIDSIKYIPEEKVIRMAYTKVTEGKAKGKVYVGRPGVDPLKLEDIGLVNISTDIEQSRRIVVKSYSQNNAIEVMGSKLADIYLSFAGGRISLNDPNLSYVQKNATDTKVQSVEDDGFTIGNNIWRIVGGTRNESMAFEFTYVDPLDSTNVSKATMNLPVAITYPAMRLVVDSTDPIQAKIWDTGVLPLRIVAGETDWSGAITSIRPVSPNKYISFNKRNWEVVWAEKQQTTIEIPIEITWSVGDTTDRKFQSTVTYVLAPWDQITFGGEWDPILIATPSGGAGEIVANFVYKGEVATQDVILVKEASIIPETIILGTGAYVENKGIVVGYQTQRGGEYPLSLVYKHVPTGLTITALIDTIIKWPNELNLVNIGSSIRGYWEDTVSLPLEFNFDGTPVSLSDPNMTITIDSGVGNPITLTNTLDTSLEFFLAKGGVQDTDYDYNVKITAKYTDNGTPYTVENTVPATIRVSAIKIGSNSKISAKVWDRGVINLTLVDERGHNVPISQYAARGTNPYVSFIEPKDWYVVSGSTSVAIETKLPVTIAYSFGGENYTMDVDVPFAIARYDGKKFVVTTETKELKGDAGSSGSIKFSFTYMGDPVTGVTLDKSRSTIPLNLLVGDLQEDGTLDYTLANQATDNVTFFFIRPGAPTPPVADQDSTTFSMTVITKSSNLDFVLESSGSAVAINFQETGVIPLSFKYGSYGVKPNAAGLTYTLSESASKSIQIVGGTETGLMVRAIRSNVSGAVTLYPEDFVATYVVGAPETKSAAWTTNVTISMGVAEINNNDIIRGRVWDRGVFAQNVKFGTGIISSIDHYEMLDANNQWVEFTAPRSWEIVFGETVTSDKNVAMRLFYKVDGSAQLQTLDFTAVFRITGYTGKRFYVVLSPANIETAVDAEQTISCRVMYKDIIASSRSVFKPDLSTIPPQVGIKSYAVVGNDINIVFTGLKAGLADTTLVFWSPDAESPTPADRDVTSGTLPTKVMGELGIEIGKRSNLLVAKPGDSGAYNMEILFGGIPIDAQAEIASGRLSFTLEAATPTNTISGALHIDSWNKDSFNWNTQGPVSPGKTVNVSDFINLSYMYGGTRFTARVEVPEQYTSSPVQIAPLTFPGMTMWKKGTLPAITAVCDGVAMNQWWTRAEDAGDVPNGYVKLTTKSYEIINADVTAKDLTFPMRYSGTYRVWGWDAEVESTWNIAPWNQLTFEVIPTSTLIDTQVGKTFRFSTSVLYKGVSTYIGTDLIDYNLTQFDGLFDVTGMSSGTINDIQVSYYNCESYLEGDKDIDFTFRRPASPLPGVEGVDWCKVTMHYKSIETPLVVTNTLTVTLANGDTRYILPRISLNGTNIALGNTNLRCILPNKTVFDLTGNPVTGSGIPIIGTLPLNTPAGALDPVKVNFEYDDAVSGKTRYGSYDQPVIAAAHPDDYPVVQNSGTYRDVDMFAVGNQNSTVRASGNDITLQCSVVSWEDGPASLYDFTANPNNYWYQITQRPTEPVGGYFVGPQNYVIKAPFRGGFVNLPAVAQWRIRTGPTENWLQATVTPSPFELIKGKAGVLTFKLTYRGVPWTDVTLNQALSGFGSSMVINSVTPSGTDVIVNFTGGDPYLATVNFTWDLNGVANPVVGKSRTSISANTFTGPDIVASPANIPIWSIQYISSFISVKMEGTELIGQCTLLSISDPWLTLVSNSPSLGGRVQRNDGITDVEVTRNVTFKIQLPVSAGGDIYDVIVPVTYPVWDGNLFTVAPWAGIGTFNRIQVTASNNFNAVAYFKGVSARTTMNVDAAKFLTLNDSAGRVTAQAYNNSAYNVTVQASKEWKGTLKIPYNYTGAGYNDWPVGTLGKNYFILEIPDVYYWLNNLKWASGAAPTTPVTGKFNDIIDIPADLLGGPDAPINMGTAANPTITIGNQNVLLYNSRTTSAPKSWKATIVYDNRGTEDVSIPVRISYASPTYGNVVLAYDQTVVVKGSGAGDTIVATGLKEVTGDVWSRGALPFGVTINGTVVTAANYKSIVVKDNGGYITNGLGTLASAYRITNGDTVAKRMTVEYTVVVTDGVRDYTLVQNVVFNINPYDGNPFKLAITSTVDAVNKWSSEVSALASIWVTGTYKGDPLTKAMVYNQQKSVITGVTLDSETPGSAGTAFRSTVNLRRIGTNYGAWMEKFAYSYDSPDGVVERSITQELIMWDNNTYRYWIDYPTTEISGKFGETLTLKGRLRLANTAVIPLNYSNDLAMSYTPNNVIKMAGRTVIESSKVETTDVVFVNEISELEKETDITWRLWSLKALASGNPILYVQDVSTVVKVTQKSGLPQPVVSDVQDVNTKINAKGGLPFKVKLEGVDVTSDVTGFTISTNSYITANGTLEWTCINAASAATTILPTITATLVHGGKTYTVSSVVKFIIAPWNGKTITAVGQAFVTTVGEKSFINITGNYSGDQLAGNVTFDVANSDAAGLVTFGAMSAATGGNLAIAITGLALGSGNVKIRLVSVHDTGSGNVGSDYLDVTVKGDVLPNNLVPVSGFETQGTGGYNLPTTLKQSVLLIDVPIDNTDANLIIGVSGTTKVFIKSVTATTITYGYVNNIIGTTDTITFDLTFTYKGRSSYIVPVTLNQVETPAVPYVANIQPLTVTWDKSFGAPFKVLVDR